MCLATFPSINCMLVYALIVYIVVRISHKFQTFLGNFFVGKTFLFCWETFFVLSLSPCLWSHLSIVHKLVHTRVKLKLTKHKFGHDHSRYKMLRVLGPIA